MLLCLRRSLTDQSLLVRRVGSAGEGVQARCPNAIPARAAYDSQRLSVPPGRRTIAHLRDISHESKVSHKRTHAVPACAENPWGRCRTESSMFRRRAQNGSNSRCFSPGCLMSREHTKAENPRFLSDFWPSAHESAGVCSARKLFPGLCNSGFGDHAVRARRTSVAQNRDRQRRSSRR